MLLSILGMLIVTVFTFNPFFKPTAENDSPKISIPLSWGIAFDFVFVLMFISSILSINPEWVEKSETSKQVRRKKRAING